MKDLNKLHRVLICVLVTVVASTLLFTPASPAVVIPLAGLGILACIGWAKGWIDAGREPDDEDFA